MICRTVGFFLIASCLFFLAACGGAGSTGGLSNGDDRGEVSEGRDSDLPTISENSVQPLSITRSDFEALKGTTQVMRWAYYMDQSRSRWYISYAGAGADVKKYDVYSLMAINAAGKNGWGTVGNDAATIDLVNETKR